MPLSNERRLERNGSGVRVIDSLSERQMCWRASGACVGRPGAGPAAYGKSSRRDASSGRPRVSTFLIQLTMLSLRSPGMNSNDGFYVQSEVRHEESETPVLTYR